MSLEIRRWHRPAVTGLSITVPNFTLGSVDPSAFTKQGGPRTQTIAIPAGLVGVATDTANGFDPTMICFPDNRGLEPLDVR